MRTKINSYIESWLDRDYKEGIPDEVPIKLMNQMLAPSYKAICIAILKNDHSMKSLGFIAKKTHWYNELKRVEIKGRNENL